MNDLKALSVSSRPQVNGKFLNVAGEKLTIRGVTYGTFRPREHSEYAPKIVERDFIEIAANGFNAIRTYTVPSRWFLDLAFEHGLFVMVGLAWEQHIAFLDDRRLVRRIREDVERSIRASANHPAVLCYAIANEIPASIVRWYGHQRIEQFLWQLYETAKAQDPNGLCTYVSYPSTEYLRLPFLDLYSCNLYLESRQSLIDYLSRLQNIAGNRPLLLAEIGIDSRRNGEENQAQILEWQVRSALSAGCAGAFIFSWTDEWYRGGHEIEDWDFGLTRRNRQAKPALATVRRAFIRGPFPVEADWPRVTVAVCSYNGSRTIRDCLEGLAGLRYPDFEVIVVDDGSTDNTGSIAEEFAFKVIVTENRGLASARNTALQAATGKIIAYIDDDARPDRDWLRFLACEFMRTNHAGIGGPNIPPSSDGLVAKCVVHAPGGPTHVLVSDTLAEHIPGCNMAFLTSALRAVGGFDPQFRVAGDDVDICWRLQERNWTLGFCPAAMVMHRRRHTVGGYWKQQEGYGKAEALLQRKWPEKYNSAGHLTWGGRLYSNATVHSSGLARYFVSRWGRIYQGTWGCEPFQSFHEVEPGLISHLMMMPEWYLVLTILGGLTFSGLFWSPLLFVLPVFFICVSATLTLAALHAGQAFFSDRPSRSERVRRRLLIFLLHLVQPMARLLGRFRYGLTPWRRRGDSGFLMPLRRSDSVWSETWRSASDRLHAIESGLSKEGLSIVRGGPYDRWDLEAWSGIHGGMRAHFAIEEHGAGKQLARLRIKPVASFGSVLFGLLLAVVSVASGIDGVPLIAAIFGLSAVLLFGRLFWECGVAGAALVASFRRHDGVTAPKPSPVGTEQRKLSVSYIARAAAAVGKHPSSSEYSDGQ